MKYGFMGTVPYELSQFCPCYVVVELRAWCKDLKLI